MTLLVYAGACVVLPAVWAVAMFFAFNRLYRRRKKEPPPIDYMI